MFLLLFRQLGYSGFITNSQERRGLSAISRLMINVAMVEFSVLLISHWVEPASHQKLGALPCASLLVLSFSLFSHLYLILGLGYSSDFSIWVPTLISGFREKCFLFGSDHLFSLELYTILNFVIELVFNFEFFAYLDLFFSLSYCCQSPNRQNWSSI